LFSSQARVVDPSAFNGFLEVVSAHLGFESAESLPEGVGRITGAGTPVEFAVRRNISFAAFRWVETADARGEVESFFVCPAGKPAHSAVRVQWLSNATAVSLSENAFFQSWQGAIGGAPAREEAVLPDFIELVCVLSSDGKVQSANSEILSHMRALESELAYARLSAADQERELGTARENLKMIAVASPAAAIEALAKAHAHVASDAATSAARGLAGLPAWADGNVERIVILPRALSGAKKSQYESPEVILEALEFLAGDYREHKRGNMSLGDFNEKLKTQQFQLANSVGASIAGEHGDQYFVRWGKRRVFLDQHLLKGGGREARYCMRIYFFFDEASGRCVVGSLPAHLENSLS
jgi:hypothetical protein